MEKLMRDPQAMARILASPSIWPVMTEATYAAALASLYCTCNVEQMLEEMECVRKRRATISLIQNTPELQNLHAPHLHPAVNPHLDQELMGGGEAGT
jgi:hypothetical protein